MVQYCASQNFLESIVVPIEQLPDYHQSRHQYPISQLNAEFHYAPQPFDNGNERGDNVSKVAYRDNDLKRDRFHP
jgi:hypothetical protein